MPLLFLGLVVLVIAILFYNYQKGMFLSGMRNESKDDISNDNENTTVQNVEPADPAGMNSGPGSATGLRTITSGRATSTMEFFAFENAPKNISEEVISNINGDK